MYQKLAKCRTFRPPHSIADHQEDIDRVEQTFEVPTYRDGKMAMATLTNPTAEQIEFARQDIKQRYELCNRISMVQREEADEWLRLSVDNGATWYEAISAYARTLGGEERAALYAEAWNDGDPLALVDLAELSRERFESGENPNGQVEALAYLLAFNMVNRKLSEANPQIPMFFGIGPETQAERERSRLLPRQVREAEAMASALIVNHDNCCLEVVSRPPLN